MIREYKEIRKKRIDEKQSTIFLYFIHLSGPSGMDTIVVLPVLIFLLKNLNFLAV